MGQQRVLEETLANIPLISFRCQLSENATLRVRLPRHYPSGPLIVSVDGSPRVSATTRSKILSASCDEATRLSGDLRHEPHCLQVLNEAMLASREESDDGGSAASFANDKGKACPTDRGSDPGVGSKGNRRTIESKSEEILYLGRRLIYSHHIIASQKRSGILKAARELKLGGFSKVSAHR